MISDLSNFLPYLLNQAAETVSLGFQPNYKNRYGMLRTEWRVLFHLGRHGEMTAKQICDQAAIHKTKVSRAVTALERKRFLKRNRIKTDRRQEALALTKAGQDAFRDLSEKADAYDQSIRRRLGEEDFTALKGILSKLVPETTAQD